MKEKKKDKPKQLKERKRGYFEHQKVFMRLENNQTKFTISAINETPPDKDILNNCFAISRLLWLQHSHLNIKMSSFTFLKFLCREVSAHLLLSASADKTQMKN